MRTLYLIFLITLAASLPSQIIDLREDRQLPEGSAGIGAAIEDPFEWLADGQFGFNADLATQATLQVLRFRIGEQSSFNLPLYLLTSANGPGFGEIPDEQLAYNSLVTPTGGLVNAFLAQAWPILGSPDITTALNATGTLGYKLIGASQLDADSNSTISSFYSDVGLRFVTGAWVGGVPDREGTFVVQTKLFATSALGNRVNLGEAFGGEDKSWYAGFSADVVLFVAETIDLRLNLAHALSRDKLFDEALQPTVVTFSVNYGVQ